MDPQAQNHFGIDEETGEPVVFDRFGDLDRPNLVLAGIAGSGKSFVGKLDLVRMAHSDIPCLILDYSGEYEHVTRRLGGRSFDIAPGINIGINPLDFTPAAGRRKNPLREKLIFLQVVLRVLLRLEYWDPSLVDELGLRVFESALIEAYAEKGYLADEPESQLHALPSQMPLLSDAVRHLELFEDSAEPEVATKARLLRLALGRFTGDGPLAALFDQPTTIKLERQVMRFAFDQLFGALMPMAMVLVLEHLRTLYFYDGAEEKARMLYIEESQGLMEYPETSQYLNLMARSASRHGVGMTLIVSDLGRFFEHPTRAENKEGIAILEEFPAALLLRQHEGGLGAIAERWGLGHEQMTRLIGAPVGEGVLVIPTRKRWVSLMRTATPLEYLLVSGDRD